MTKLPHYSKTFLLFATLLTNPLVQAEIVPFKASYEAEWDLGWFPIRVDAIRELKKLNNNDWQMEFRADSSVAEFKEGTTFQQQDNQIIPLTYYQKRGGLLPNENLVQEFNWKTGLINTRSEEHKKAKTLKTQPYLHSKMTYQLQLGLDLQSEKLSYSYPVASTRKIRHKDFEIIGEESIKTDLGVLDCIVLRMVPARKNSKEKTKIWLAKDYNNLEVRFWIHEKSGDEYTVEITKGTMDGKPIVGRDIPQKKKKRQFKKR